MLPFIILIICNICLAFDSCNEIHVLQPVNSTGIFVVRNTTVYCDAGYQLLAHFHANETVLSPAFTQLYNTYFNVTRADLMWINGNSQGAHFCLKINK